MSRRAAGPNTRTPFFDWRLVLALTVAAAMAFIIYSSLHGQRVRAAERAQEATEVAGLTQQIDSLTHQILTLQEASAARAALSQENQRRMLDYTAAQDRRQQALLRYVRKHGLSIPLRFLEPVQVPTLRKPLPVPHHNRHSGTTSHSGKGSTTTSAPSAPGKSGTHRHHPFHSKGSRGHHGSKAPKHRGHGAHGHGSHRPNSARGTLG